MHNPDVRRNADPLALTLEEANRVRPFNVYSSDGTAAPTGSPEVDPATHLLVHPNGKLDPRVRLIGIPTYAQLPDTTISPMPGTNPLMPVSYTHLDVYKRQPRGGGIKHRNGSA